MDRLNRVVGGFLDYARPSTGVVGRANVNAVLRRTVQLLWPECEAAGVTLDLQEDASLPEVQIDVERLRQVVINLVQNAAQAMGTGVVRIRTERRERADANGRTLPWAELRIEDTGPGIPPDVLSKLFVPFFTTREKGTGLGLAISQRIVSAAGGVINVRSRVGTGTTFTVLLPGDTSLGEATGAMAALPSPAATASPQGARGAGAAGTSSSVSSGSHSSGGKSASMSAASSPAPGGSSGGSGGATAAAPAGSTGGGDTDPKGAGERPRLVTTSR